MDKVHEANENVIDFLPVLVFLVGEIRTFAATMNNFEDLTYLKRKNIFLHIKLLLLCQMIFLHNIPVAKQYFVNIVRISYIRG